MSVFRRAIARADRAIAQHLSDGEAVYRSNDGAVIEAVPYQLDLECIVHDDYDGIDRKARTILVPVSVVPSSGHGDQIEAAGRVWRFGQTLEDDGSWRRIEVT